MDYQQNEQNNWYASSNQTNQPTAPSPGRTDTPMAIASMVLGITSIIMCCTGVLSIPLGALGILLAVLTKRKGRPMPGKSIAGIATSVIGLFLGFIMFAYLIFCSALLVSPELQNMMDPLFEETYGMSFEEYMEYSGVDLDDYSNLFD